MTMQARQKQLVAHFSGLASWEEKYRKIIELGRALPAYPEVWRLDDLKVKGCQSQVWLHAEMGPDRRIQLAGDSDALIVKGLVALLLELYSQATPEEILQTSPEFVMQLDLGTHLSPSRANGLFAVVKQIKYYAAAFQALQPRA